MLSSTSTRPTRPSLLLNSVPPLWGGPRNTKNAPLYGLGWRSSLDELFRKYETSSLCTIRDIVVPPFLEELQFFSGKMKYGFRFMYDPSADDKNTLCLVTFNSEEKTLATLAGPDGVKFIELMKKMLKMTPEDEATFMWYDCTGMVF